MQTGFIHFGVVIEVGMVVIYFVVEYCHYYMENGVTSWHYTHCDVMSLININKYKNGIGGTVTIKLISKWMFVFFDKGLWPKY